MFAAPLHTVRPPPKNFFLNCKGADTIAINCFLYSIFHISNSLIVVSPVGMENLLIISTPLSAASKESYPELR
jgi:hypothetical protein